MYHLINYASENVDVKQLFPWFFSMLQIQHTDAKITLRYRDKIQKARIMNI